MENANIFGGFFAVALLQIILSEQLQEPDTSKYMTQFSFFGIDGANASLAFYLSPDELPVHLKVYGCWVGVTCTKPL